jgi:hypothetical protein
LVIKGYQCYYLPALLLLQRSHSQEYREEQTCQQDGAAQGLSNRSSNRHFAVATVLPIVPIVLVWHCWQWDPMGSSLSLLLVPLARSSGVRALHFLAGHAPMPQKTIGTGSTGRTGSTVVTRPKTKNN